MGRKSGTKTTLFFLLISLISLLAFAPVFAPLPSFSSHYSLSPRHRHHHHRKVVTSTVAVKPRSFEIDDDKFWKDGEFFRIIGGDLHYFRVLPQASLYLFYWEDRLVRAKALGLNTIQTYVPWNLHEPQPGKLVFEGIADLVSFLKLCHKLDILVMLRPGPYICGEWDLGGFPAWLLAIEPPLKLRSSDPAYLRLVCFAMTLLVMMILFIYYTFDIYGGDFKWWTKELHFVLLVISVVDNWWGILLPKVAPFLYNNGGPIIMVQFSMKVIILQIENEFGSYGDDKAYLHHLVKLAQGHLGDGIILYTTDGGSRENLEKGTIRGDAVFSTVDFTTGDDPWPIFKLQKEFNAPGKSPPLSSEFYTGWLTHWGEKNAKTGADFTASALEKILSQNGSAVLYMVHGGTNFGFYNGANTGVDESDYKPDITSYDYDAPISESGDVENAKFNALRRVIELHTAASLPSVPSDNGKMGYGPIQLQKTAFLFDLLDNINPADVVESENPLSMESVGQMFGFLLYVSEYTPKDDKSVLLIPEVHDRAQVFTLCHSEDNSRRPTRVGSIDRLSSKKLGLPNAKCASNISLFVLVENQGHVNYGPYMFDKKGILSSVFLDGSILHGWKMIPIPFHNLNEVPKINLIIEAAHSRFITVSTQREFKDKSGNVSEVPAFFTGHFFIENANQIHDTFISFSGWGKGIAVVNDFNIGRYWPSYGPQCNLYVPAPILRHGENVLVILELESPSPELVIHSVDHPDFTCGSSKSSVHQL
ncbi:hypothetical protein POTOM_011492 [Populus tomentosa]|uniref:Beta-galactosidase n=1 Tax=Populus tomentosa TaxID=118781 RepID=A0A8X8DAI9_POPTO|nr:hypothetical protein POTOM_011492 [Populus tomentosa]